MQTSLDQLINESLNQLEQVPEDFRKESYPIILNHVLTENRLTSVADSRKQLLAEQEEKRRQRQLIKNINKNNKKIAERSEVLPQVS